MKHRFTNASFGVPVLLVLAFMVYMFQQWSLRVKQNSDCDLSPEKISQLQDGFTQVDDPCLIKFIRQSWLAPPSTKPYDPPGLGVKDTSQEGQSRAVQSFLNGRKHGFFIECGAADGKTFSNTLLLERNDMWTGLLIEANPTYYQSIVKLNRKAYATNACLSPSNSTQRLQFAAANLLGGLVSGMNEGHKAWIRHKSKRMIIAQCFPLYSILLALETLHIDYFSLDVEGPELDILKTIPLSKVIIDLFSIEFRCMANSKLDTHGSRAKLTKIREYFKSTKLYEEVGIRPNGSQEEKGLDVFFRRIPTR